MTGNWLSYDPGSLGA